MTRIKDIISLGVPFFDKAAESQLSALFQIQAGVRKLDKELRLSREENKLLHRKIKAMNSRIVRMKKKLQQREIPQESCLQTQIKQEVIECEINQRCSELPRKDSEMQLTDALTADREMALNLSGSTDMVPNESYLTVQIKTEEIENEDDQECDELLVPTGDAAYTHYIDASGKEVLAYIGSRGSVAQPFDDGGGPPVILMESLPNDLRAASMGEPLEDDLLSLDQDEHAIEEDGASMCILRNQRHTDMTSGAGNENQQICDTASVSTKDDVLPFPRCTVEEGMSEAERQHLIVHLEDGQATNTLTLQERSPSKGHKGTLSSGNKSIASRDIIPEHLRQKRKQIKKGERIDPTVSSTSAGPSYQSSLYEYTSGSRLILKKLGKPQDGDRPTQLLTSDKMINAEYGSSPRFKTQMESHQSRLQSRVMSNTRVPLNAKERRYKCTLCLKSFLQKNNLIAHTRIHTGERPFECNACTRRFSCKSHLNRHMRIHTGERPFECEFCMKSFSQKGHLITHVRIHTGEKPYQCSVCLKSFSSKSYFNCHMRIHARNKTL